MNIYVGNIPREASEEDLREVFSEFGQVASVTFIKDKFSGESRGFGFVEMPATAEAQAAITGLNGKDLMGRTLTVNEARPRPERRDDRNQRGGGGAGRGRDQRGGNGGGGSGAGGRRFGSGGGSGGAGGGGGRRSW